MSTERLCKSFPLCAWETYGIKYNIYAETGSDFFFPSHPCLEYEWRIFFYPISEFTGVLATESTSENGSNECQWRFPEEKGHGWSSSVQPKLFPLAAVLRKYTTLSQPLRPCNTCLSKTLPLNPIYIQIPSKSSVHTSINLQFHFSTTSRSLVTGACDCFACKPKLKTHASFIQLSTSMRMGLLPNRKSRPQRKGRNRRSIPWYNAGLLKPKQTQPHRP